MGSSVYRTAGLQIVTSVGAGTLGYMLQGQVVAKAALYGGVVALMGTLLLIWRMRRSERNLLLETHQHLWLFYRSSLERFLIISALLALGMGPLGLAPAAVLISFVAAQLAWVIAPLIRDKKKLQ